ncbi:single-stranded DNA-binding protein [Actinoplanes oblitus]|uniref:Single-stranded DNA-binding protein n=1 Tax=Actinoplanes oblitus TaxID=3040509 RepID=A0ABY8WMN4_9ACTN|nr:single-stranded DNA-binding protein [Actinoplanes oblitus]WIM97589.1 single-stranded DNA-binding protein [Actinoplanes oblitus]
MFDTHIVVVGNVLTKPEWRRTTNSNQLVANFRLASTARRYDRENRCWVDGNTLRVRVSAWRKLAENVGSSINIGDPVIVFGRLYTRDWQDEEANHRVSYEMEALAVGHDLARGRSRFYRTRPAATSAQEDTEADAVIGGEPAEPVADNETPVRYGDGLPEIVPGEAEPAFLEVVADLADEESATATTAEDEPATAEIRRTRRTKKEPVAA